MGNLVRETELACRDFARTKNIAPIFDYSIGPNKMVNLYAREVSLDDSGRLVMGHLFAKLNIGYREVNFLYYSYSDFPEFMTQNLIGDCV